MELHLDQCPVCGGELVTKEVTKVLRGGGNTATLKVQAEVCLLYGERFYTMDTARRFDEIRAKLKRQDTKNFEPIGRSFRVI